MIQNINDIQVLIRKIILNQLELESERFFFGLEGFILPKDEKLNLILSFVSTKIIGKSREMTNNSLGVSKNVANLQSEFAIDLISKNNSCHHTHSLLLLFLTSNYAINKYYENGIRVDVPNSFVDLSFIEGPTPLKRIRINFLVFWQVSQSENQDYWDKLQEGEANFES